MRITVTRSVIQAEAARKAESKAARKAARRDRHERLPLRTRLGTLVGREPRPAEHEIEQPIREVT